MTDAKEDLLTTLGIFQAVRKQTENAMDELEAIPRWRLFARMHALHTVWIWNEAWDLVLNEIGRGRLRTAEGKADTVMQEILDVLEEDPQ